MSRQMHKLAARTVATSKKPGMLGDGGGLYLQVSKGGTKSWIYRFMLRGRSRDMGLGGADVVSLSEARDLALQARKLVKAGTDPIETKNTQQRQDALKAATTLTFAECAEAYIKTHEAGWRSAKHREQWRNTLDAYASSVFGDLPVDAIDTGLVMQAIEPIWTTKTETASRLRGRIEAVLDWAKTRGYRSGENPARWRGHLKHLLPKKGKLQKVKHHPALSYRDIFGFMKALRERDATTARGLEFLILTAVRPSEVVGATWDEFDLDKAVWTIPGNRMKAGKEHRVPLSDMAVSILRKMEEGRFSSFVFPGRKAERPLTTGAFLRLMVRMEHPDITSHGFRSAFRDWASEETNFSRETAEAALAHTIGNKVEEAYRRGDLFEKRRKLMEAWATYCDLESTGEVVPIGRARK
jgi:integrase